MPRSDRDPYRAIFESTPLPLLICDVGTLQILSVNSAAAKLHGMTEEELEGTLLSALRRVSDLTSVMLERAVGAELALGFGYHTHRDGSLFPVQLTVHPSELGGQPVWLCELKSLAELVSPRQGEPQRRLLEAVGRLAGGVAHDINNLSSVILSFARLAGAQLPSTCAAHKELTEIRGAAERASALCKQVLRLSRQGAAVPKPLQLNDVICRMDKLLQRLLDEHVVLELKLEPEADLVLADAAHVERLLVQLVSEVRSTDKPARLCIETRNVAVETERGTDRQVMLRVSDSESSLSPEVAALSALVASGSAWLESRLGQGGRFVACFPSFQAGTKPPGAEARPPRSETVLVVQDNPHLRKTLKTYFAREGYRVLDAENSLEAWRVVEQCGRVDLLLTDFVLPDGSGSDLGRALRERLPSLRVLVAISTAEQRAALRLDERTAVISKPFDLQEFGALVQQLVAQPNLI